MTAETEPRTLTDWRGNPYTVGSTVFYPRMSGRSCEIQEGTVTDIWDAVYDFDKGRWVRFDPGNPKHQAEVERGRRIRTKVKVQPTGRGSRDFYRDDTQIVKDEHGEYVRDDEGHAMWEPKPIKPVTIEVIENITVATCTHRGGTR